MDKNIDVLQEVLDLLEEEKRKFYNLVDQNDFRIEEINSYLRELSKNDGDDFKVFSPRNAENKHREQIEADTVEKEKCEKENIEYKKKIEYLKLLSDKVYIVIHNLQIENESVNRISIEKENTIEDPEAENLKSEDMNADDKIDMENNISVENEHLAHQILNCVSFIIPDAERAKVELTAIAEKLKRSDFYRI